MFNKAMLLASGVASSNYYVMSDYPSSEEGLESVKAYRKALRDLSKQKRFPFGTDWPTMPDVLG